MHFFLWILQIHLDSSNSLPFTKNTNFKFSRVHSNSTLFQHCQLLIPIICIYIVLKKERTRISSFWIL